MNKFIKSIAILFLGVLTLSFGSLMTNHTIHATKNEDYSIRVLTNEETARIEKFIEIESGYFKLNEQNDLSKELRFLANKSITQMNQQIKQQRDSGITLFVDQNTKTIMTTGLLTRGYGKNDIKYHWNYMRVYIDKGTLRQLSSDGLIIAGVTIPNKIVGIAVGLLGTRTENIQHGIWFDYNYFKAAAGMATLGIMGTATSGPAGAIASIAMGLPFGFDGAGYQ